MPDTPNIAQTATYKIELEQGKTYFRCSCGHSANQPFCDGSHETTTITPIKFTAEASKTAFLCGCKHTANQPFCDGAHKAL